MRLSEEERRLFAQLASQLGFKGRSLRRTGRWAILTIATGTCVAVGALSARIGASCAGIPAVGIGFDVFAATLFIEARRDLRCQQR